MVLRRDVSLAVSPRCELRPLIDGPPREHRRGDVSPIPATLARAERGTSEELGHASHRMRRDAAQDRATRIVAGADQVPMKPIVTHAPRRSRNRVTTIVASTGRSKIGSREPLRHRPFQSTRSARAIAGTMSAAGEALGRAEEGSRRQEHASGSHRQSHR